MKKLIVIALILTSLGVKAQNKTADENAIKATINNLFNGMRQSDTSLIANAFAPQSIMQTIVKSRDGITGVRQEKVSNFVASMSGNHPLYDEKIKFTSILIDGDLAAVWTDYQFFVDNKFSHCGVNSFQLARMSNGWKIIYIIDTRRKDQCADVN